MVSENASVVQVKFIEGPNADRTYEFSQQDTPIHIGRLPE
jgi:hypothetical protein